MNAALTWTGPLAHRGTHRRRNRIARRLEQRAYDRADRKAAARYLKRVINSAELKRNAGKTARNACLWVPLVGLANFLIIPGLNLQALIASGTVWALAAIVGGVC